MSDAWRGELIDAYRHHRLDAQIGYYGAKAADFERARRWTVTVRRCWSGKPWWIGHRITRLIRRR